MLINLRYDKNLIEFIMDNHLDNHQLVEISFFVCKSRREGGGPLALCKREKQGEGRKEGENWED